MAESEKRTHRVALALTPKEYAKLERAARKVDRELAVFARKVLLEALARRRK